MHRDSIKNDLEIRTKRFALGFIQLVNKLPKGKAADVLSYQVLKSATSIGANYREVRRGQSTSDFIHKLAICEKEAAETQYWLELLLESGLVDATCGHALLDESGELLAIFVSSGKTAKSRA